MFRERLDAWREAERAGRSLADHLADASSEDAMPSTSDPSDDDVEDLVAANQRFGSEPSAVTDVLPMTVPARSLGSRPSAPALDAASVRPAAGASSPGSSRLPAPASSQPLIAIAPTPAPEVVGAAGGSNRGARALVIAIVALILLGGAAFAWLLLFRRPAAETTDDPSGVVMAGITADAAAGVAIDVDSTDDAAAVAVDSEAQEIVPEHEPTTDAASTDADEPDDGDEPAVGSGGNESSSPRNKNHRKKPKTTAVASVPKVAATEPCQPPGKVDPFDKRPVCGAAAKPPNDTTPKVTTTEPPKPKVTTTEPPKPSGLAPGTMDAAAVRSVVRSHLGEITACVSRARMDDRDLKGKVQIRIDVAPTGRVTKTAVASSTGATPALETCMLRAVAGWTFPAPAGGVRGAFSYPFAF